ncbi:MAG: hypothetical protein E7242_02190 [Lachnospiraceae bacterium]|nr:hypothetical protein [Lachnospiraceae bacterium]
MKTVIISDLHLGIDDKYAETIKNRPLLVSFLEKLINEKEIDELVINGDFFDQWVLPADYDCPEDTDAFYKACAKNNEEVMDAFKALMKAGIKLVYIPGNHDMTMSAETLDAILPGIVQAREGAGLGSYRTGERGEVLIEHSHRYELFCAPDCLSNKEFMEYGEPILPLGFFFSKIGMSLVGDGSFENMPENPIKIAEIEKPAKDAPDYDTYLYYKIWYDVITSMFPAERDLDEKFVKVRVDGFKGEFSVKDILPEKHPDGIYAKLYKNVQGRWEELQKLNGVKSPVDVRHHIEHIIDQNERMLIPKRQYFDADESIDLVVFGHSHIPIYKEYEGYGRKKIFVNEGSWLDINYSAPEYKATFALVESTKDGTNAKVYKCERKGKELRFVDITEKIS